jgi:hypothetical protein
VSLFGRIVGIIGSVFQIGGPNGPSLTAASGRITASGNVAGSSPVAPSDFVTLAYGNTAYGAGTLFVGSFTTTFFGDEAIGVVTGLSAAPLKVIAQSVVEQGVTGQSGFCYDCIATQLNSAGFNWRIKVLGNESWPVTVTLKVSYLWSST